jgi:hypothetical protein
MDLDRLSLDMALSNLHEMKETIGKEHSKEVLFEISTKFSSDASALSSKKNNNIFKSIGEFFDSCEELNHSFAIELGYGKVSYLKKDGSSQQDFLNEIDAIKL